LRYDDATDIQGEWSVTGDNTTMVIDGSQMHLTSEIAYTYTIDTTAKTISYFFGPTYKGQVTYHFSNDRSSIVLRENSAPAGWLVDWGLQEDPLLNGSADISTGETLLKKISDSTTALPQKLTNNTTVSANAAGKVLDQGSSS
jgi:hypothetical protein